MFKLSRFERLIVFFLVGVILVGGAVASVRKYLKIKKRGRSLTIESISLSGERALSQEIIIHITGAVKRPGLYCFRKGARVSDAIETAGGPEEDALLDILNLTQPLKDGSKIVVSRSFDAAAFKKEAVSAAQRERKKPQVAKKQLKININRASREELEKFLGLNSKTALAIVKYRQKHGPFQEISEIKKARWVGQRKYKKLKDRITVK